MTDHNKGAYNPDSKFWRSHPPLVMCLHFEGLATALVASSWFLRFLSKTSLFDVLFPAKKTPWWAMCLLHNHDVCWTTVTKKGKIRHGHVVICLMTIMAYSCSCRYNYSHKSRTTCNRNLMAIFDLGFLSFLFLKRENLISLFSWCLEPQN